MQKARKTAAFAASMMCLLCLTGCTQPSEILTELLLEMAEEESTSAQTIPRQTEAETEIPPETEETTSTTAPEPTEPLVLNALCYAEPYMLETFDYFAATEGADVPDKMRSVNWADVPYFEESEQLGLYLEQELRQCRKQIPVIARRGCRVLDLEIYHSTYGLIDGRYQICEMTRDGVKLKFVVYDVDYATGTLCLYAQATGDRSVLEERDRAAYEEAKRFLAEELDTSADPIAQEKQIHDYICEKTLYIAESPDIFGHADHRTAAGVLLDGRANCMGYSDAFYLLASMAGFTVQKDHNEDHMWNLIAFEDGLHLVDLTWDDDGIQFQDGTQMTHYRYFNAGMDIVGQEYDLYEDSQTRNIVASCQTHTLEEVAY